MREQHKFGLREEKTLIYIDLKKAENTGNQYEVFKLGQNALQFHKFISIL